MFVNVELLATVIDPLTVVFPVTLRVPPINSLPEIITLPPTNSLPEIITLPPTVALFDTCKPSLAPKANKGPPTLKFPATAPLLNTFNVGVVTDTLPVIEGEVIATNTARLFVNVELLATVIDPLTVVLPVTFRVPPIISLPLIITLPPTIALFDTCSPLFAPKANKGPPIFAWPEFTNPNVVFVKYTCWSTRILF